MHKTGSMWRYPIIAVISIILLGSTFLFLQPKKIITTMNGIILDKETKQMIGKTSIAMDLERHEQKDRKGEYQYKGTFEVDAFPYTKENSIMFQGGSQNQIPAILPYVHNIEKDGEIQPYISTISLYTITPELTNFVLLNYDENGTVNTKEIIVFPAETEEEALQVLEQFQEITKVWE